MSVSVPTTVPITKKKQLPEEWIQLSRENSYSEISSVRVPIATEESWDQPDNLSDILKQVNEKAEMLLSMDLLGSREELMELKEFVNDKSTMNMENVGISQIEAISIDGIPHTDENLTAILNQKVQQFIQSQKPLPEPNVIKKELSEGVIEDEQEMLKAIQEMQKN